MGEELKAEVRRKYGAAATRAAEGGVATCCGGGSGCGSEVRDFTTRDLYDEATVGGLPPAAVLASLGCGNPTALADLQEGQVVLDLGSGGGIDVLLSARRVGPTGHAYGLDTTDEMLDLARKNAAAAGATNVAFLKGDMEAIPLPDASVDVIISNCVINLSADKRRVLAEAFRVLKPGGRLAVSDVVVRGEVPAAVRRSMELWIGCLAGALEEGEFHRLLGEAGFEDAELEPTRIYEAADARPYLEAAGIRGDELDPAVDGRFMAAFVRARKPREIRAARAEDGEAILDLLRSSSLPTQGVEGDLDGFVVARDEAAGCLDGVAGLEIHGGEALLRSVAVRPDAQGSGLGGRLVRILLDQAAARGLAGVYLLTTTAPDFFRRHGFRTVSRDEVPVSIRESSEFRDVCPSSAEVMVHDPAGRASSPGRPPSTG